MARIAIFCGSSDGVRPAYLAAARDLGARLAREGHGIVYGGASIGLMGALADAALAAGGEVIGVMPSSLVAREIAHPDLDALHVVDSMHARKALMATLSDAFAALPGGFGTLDELFEILTWRQLGHHDKPITLLDVDGYFSRLLAFVDHVVAEGFASPASRALIEVAEAGTWSPTR